MENPRLWQKPRSRARRKEQKPTRYFIPADLSKIRNAIDSESNGCFVEFDEKNAFVCALSEREIEIEKKVEQTMNPALQTICKTLPQIDAFQACIIERLYGIENDYWLEYSRFAADVKETYPLLFFDKAVIWQVIRSLCSEQIVKLQVVGPGEHDMLDPNGWLPEILVKFEDYNVLAKVRNAITMAWAKDRKENAER